MRGSQVISKTRGSMKPTTKSLLLLLFATNCCASIQKRDGEGNVVLSSTPFIYEEKIQNSSSIYTEDKVTYIYFGF